MKHGKKESDTPTEMGSETQESIKPFRLVKYFSLTSLVVILIPTLALSVFISHRAKNELLRKSEEYALLVASNLNHQVFTQFVLPTALKFGRIELSNSVQFERLDKVVRNTIHGFNIDRVDVYDLNELVTYSTDPSLVGLSGLGGIDFNLARQGQSSSSLVSRGSYLGFELGAVAKQRKLKTYIPLRIERPLSREYGRILGVFEITQDISEDYAAITRFQNIIIISLLVVMSLLFFVLRLIVKRGERIIAKRTEERRRLEEQLHLAERMAALGEMVAGISHEIRNPLGIIGSTAELLHQKTDEGDSKKQLGKIIMEETSRLNSIVTDFLDFARPTTPDFAECQVEQILESNLKFLEIELKRRSIQVERHFAENGRTVLGDADLLYRAFLNIFVNALEAVDEGGTIQVATRRRNSQGDTLEVVITDTGSGISQDTIGKVFDPFFTTRRTGTGLGLSIVRNIIESHGGTVNIESPPLDKIGDSENEGTAIIISLRVTPAGS
ncbi:MAG: two-component sensor histidine kinase [Deltaproteobacteria bacterium]|nr:MAG: two-component sensor histidine kinase [Deltaproteobacteria bacterium]